MPNWVQNKLTFIVPTDRADAFMAAISGPGDWHWPKYENHSNHDLEEKLSNHEKLQIEERRDELTAEFRAAQPEGAMPDWMPVSRQDIVGFMLNGRKLEETETTVPFSVVRLRPWKDRAEFDRIFPGVEEKGFWKADPARQGDYNSGNLGFIAMSYQVLGVKWPPGHVEIRDRNIIDTDPNFTEIVIDYQTPWGAIQDIASLLRPVLETFGARALVVWEEEDNNSGFDYVDPSRDMALSESFRDEMLKRSEDSEEDDEEGYLVIDSERLWQTATERSEDPLL